MAGLPERLACLVRSTPWLLEALRAARDVDPPDWLVGGGVLRDLVWDRLHGRSRPALPRDLDLAFFDPARLDPARDAEVEAALAARLPGVPWDAKNQAAVHIWYGRVFGGTVAPLTSAADGVATWPETATAAAVRLLDDDRIEVVAPCGLEDLFGLVCRRNPRRVSVARYRRRIHDKRIADRWPRVQILDPAPRFGGQPPASRSGTGPPGRGRVAHGRGVCWCLSTGTRAGGGR